MHVKAAKFLWPLPLVGGLCAFTGCTARAQVFRPVPLCWLITDPARKKRVDLASVCGRAILHQVAPQERLPVEFFQVCPHGIWQSAFTPISFRRRAHRTQGTYRVRKSPCRRPQRCKYFESSGHPRPGTTAAAAAIHAGQTTLVHTTRTADALERVKWLIGLLQIHTHATAARHRHTIRRAACTLLNM